MTGYVRSIWATGLPCPVAPVASGIAQGSTAWSSSKQSGSWRTLASRALLAQSCQYLLNRLPDWSQWEWHPKFSQAIRARENDLQLCIYGASQHVGRKSEQLWQYHRESYVGHTRQSSPYRVLSLLVLCKLWKQSQAGWWLLEAKVVTMAQSLSSCCCGSDGDYPATSPRLNKDLGLFSIQSSSMHSSLRIPAVQLHKRPLEIHRSFWVEFYTNRWTFQSFELNCHCWQDCNRQIFGSQASI